MDLSKVYTSDYYGLRYKGYLRIPEDGVYSFHAPRELVHADNATSYELRMYIDGEEWYLTQWWHGLGTWSVALQKGFHTFQLDFVDARTKPYRKSGLWRWYPRPWVVYEGKPSDILLSGPGLRKQRIPKEWFYRQPVARTFPDERTDPATGKLYHNSEAHRRTLRERDKAAYRERVRNAGLRVDGTRPFEAYGLHPGKVRWDQEEEIGRAEVVEIEGRPMLALGPYTSYEYQMRDLTHELAARNMVTPSVQWQNTSKAAEARVLIESLTVKPLPTPPRGLSPRSDDRRPDRRLASLLPLSSPLRA